jgi:hypothetical protein
MCVHATDVVFANQVWPGWPLWVGTEGAATTLQSCEFHSVRSVKRTLIVLGDFGQSGESAGVTMQNITSTNSDFASHVEAWNDTEVYADDSAIVFRYFNNGTQEGGAQGKYEVAKDLSDASTSKLQFISASDGVELIKVRL